MIDEIRSSTKSAVTSAIPFSRVVFTYVLLAGNMRNFCGNSNQLFWFTKKS
jgi:hypothetical protein